MAGTPRAKRNLAVAAGTARAKARPVAVAEAEALRAQVTRWAESVSPSILAAADARGVLEAAIAIKHAASAVEGLAAKAVAESEAWRQSGDRSPAHLLSRLAGTSVSDARETLATAGRMEELPAVQGALRRGELSPRQSALIAEAATVDPSAEKDLLQVARSASLGELGQACAKRRAAADPDPEATRARIHRGRYLRTHHDTEGAWNLHARATTEVGARIMAALAPFAEERFQAARGSGQREPLEAYQLDALATMAEVASADPVDAVGPIGAAGSSNGAVPPGAAGSRGTAGPHTGADPVDAVGPIGAAGSRTGAGPPDIAGSSGGTAARATAGSRGATSSPSGTGPRGAAGSRSSRTAGSGAGTGSSGPAGAGGAGAGTAGAGMASAGAGAAGAGTGGAGAGTGGGGGGAGTATGPSPAAPPAGTPTKRPRRRPPAKIIVRIDMDALLRGRATGGEICELAGIPVPVSVVKELAASDNPFLAAVVTKGQAVAGVVHLGRRPTAAQMTALEWLAPSCSVLGCSQSTRLEIDHVEDWAKTHTTRIEHLAPLCGHHHWLKTNEDWALVEGTGKRAMVPPGDPRHPGRATQARRVEGASTEPRAGPAREGGSAGRGKQRGTPAGGTSSGDRHTDQSADSARGGRAPGRAGPVLPSARAGRTPAKRASQSSRPQSASRTQQAGPPGQSASQPAGRSASDSRARRAPPSGGANSRRAPPDHPVLASGW